MTLVIAGGNLIEHEKLIMQRFLDAAGGENALVALVGVASEEPEDRMQRVADTLCALGAKPENLRRLPVTCQTPLLEKGWHARADESIARLIEGAGGVWFVGGDQRRITAAFLNADGSDTEGLSAIRKLAARGGAVGGTSAGAAIMSRVMIGAGTDEGALCLPVCGANEIYSQSDADNGRLLVTQGLGFIDNAIIDQHFNRRARLQRLMRAMRYAGVPDGLGVSEDTALIVANGAYQVLGGAYVTHVKCINNDFYVKTYIQGASFVL